MEREGRVGEGDTNPVLLSRGDTEVEAEMVPPPLGLAVLVGGATVPDTEREGEWEKEGDRVPLGDTLGDTLELPLRVTPEKVGVMERVGAWEGELVALEVGEGRAVREKEGVGV